MMGGRSPEAARAIGEARSARDRFAELAGRAMLATIERRRSVGGSVGNPGPTDAEVDRAWRDLVGRLRELRVVHGERTIARKIRENCEGRAYEVFRDLALARGWEVIPASEWGGGDP
jgi:hypothetical protein